MNVRCRPRPGHGIGWLPAVAGALLAAAASGPCRAERDQDFGMWAGMEFVSGEYGGDERVDEWSTRFSAWARLGRISLQLTVPWLSVDAPTGTIIDRPGGPIIGDGPRRTESGLGDVTTLVTLRDAWTSGRSALDLTGQVKFGTADEDGGLGTGETDITVQADYLAFYDRWTGLVSVGYAFRGDPDDYELEDGVVAAAGGLFPVGAANRLGLFVEYRQAAYLDNDDPLELAGFYAWRAGSWRTSLSLRAGLSDSVPDWGAGVSVGTTF